MGKEVVDKESKKSRKQNAQGQAPMYVINVPGVSIVVNEIAPQR
jgi:hypothetical protein